MKKAKPKKTGKKKIKRETLRRNFSLSDSFKLFQKKKTPQSLYTKDDNAFIGVGDGLITITSDRGADFFELGGKISELLTHETSDVKIEFIPKGSNRKYILNRKPPPKTKEQLEREEREMSGYYPGYPGRRR